MKSKPTRLTEPDPDRLLATALRLAGAGYPVFPCRPDEKRPLTRHGLHDATTDPTQIRAWWSRTPTANLAIATGVRSFDVLDIDVRPRGSGYPAYHRLIRAGLSQGRSLTVVTPSGGMHVYYRGTSQPSASLPKQHIDFKASGGYVLAPPSVVAGRAYEYCQHFSPPYTPLDWPTVRAFLQPDAEPTRPRGLPRWPVNADSAVEQLARWVAHLPEGHRNNGTFWAACRAVEQGTSDLRPLLDAAIKAGLSEAEAARTIASATRTVDSRTRPPARPFRPPNQRLPGPGR